MAFGVVPPAPVPGEVEQQRHGDDPGAPQAALAAALEDVDRHPQREGDPEAGEADRQRERDAGEDVAAAVAAFEREQHRDAEEDRADEADLEGPEQDLPGGAEEEQQRRPRSAPARRRARRRT